MKALYNISSKILKSLIIISTILFLQVNTTFAEGNTINPSVTLSMNTLLSILAPTTPATSDFSDAELNLSDIETLAPVVPSEAGFGDSDEIKINMNYLALDVPAEADFNDADMNNLNITSLAPVPPSEADFND